MASTDMQIKLELSPEFKARLSELARPLDGDLAVLRAENHKLRKLAERAVERYPEGHEDEGAYIVIIEDDYDRLTDLEEAIQRYGESE